MSVEPTKRFSDRASDYVKFRPSYPAGAIDAVLDGLPADAIIGDAGAGTGIFSRLLADRGVSVFAVEPNAAMRDSGEPHPRVKFIDGTAERTTLADSSAHAVTAAQAFHWFDQPRALVEFARILKPGGRLALVWNDRDERDAFTAGYGEALTDVAGADPAASRDKGLPMVSASGLFTPIKTIEVPSQQPFDVDGLLGRARSASYVPKEGPMWERLEKLLRELHARHADAGGIAAMKYVTRVYRAQPS